MVLPRGSGQPCRGLAWPTLVTRSWGVVCIRKETAGCRWRQRRDRVRRCQE
jgi:hypothetical protein